MSTRHLVSIDSSIKNIVIIKKSPNSIQLEDFKIHQIVKSYFIINKGKPISRVLSCAVIYLVLLLPVKSSNLPPRKDGQPSFLPLLGLAPNGVYTANLLPNCR